jgi:hypothetical protein
MSGAVTALVILGGWISAHSSAPALLRWISDFFYSV